MELLNVASNNPFSVHVWPHIVPVIFLYEVHYFMANSTICYIFSFSFCRFYLIFQLFP